MPFHLDQVVPWGRSFDEYRRMFALTEADLRCAILGCADGPASFNAELTRRGGRVVSCDPLYQCTAAQIRGRIDATYDQVMEQTERNRHQFVWDTIPSVAELERVRMDAMQAFLADYKRGRGESRYVAAELPCLPFPDNSFGLALCSHFLFLYTDQLDLLFHRHAIAEMLRVASEVRIFPLLDLAAAPSRHVEPIVAALKAEGQTASCVRVPYEFQRGGNEMLRVRRRRTGSCDIEGTQDTPVQQRMSRYRDCREAL